jgi:hypothetical protein
MSYGDTPSPYDGLTPKQRWKYSLVSFLTAILFLLLVGPYTLITKAITSLDWRTIAFGQFFIPLPLSIFLSVRIYDAKLFPVVEQIIRARQERLLASQNSDSSNK